MNWVEILQVVGPILLGLAGILSGYGIAVHQSTSAADAEARARVLVASADLLAVANQVYLHLTSWETQTRAGAELPAMTMAPEEVLARANSSAAVLLLLGRPLGFSANHLVACVTGSLMLLEKGGTAEHGARISVTLMNAIATFANEAGTAVAVKKSQAGVSRGPHARS